MLLCKPYPMQRLLVRTFNIGPMGRCVMTARAVRRRTVEINYHTRQNSAYRFGHTNGGRSLERPLFSYPLIKKFCKLYSSIAKSTILQYRQCIAGGGFATKSRRSYCPRKADGFAAAFSGTANNTVVCNRGQYKIGLR